MVVLVGWWLVWWCLTIGDIRTGLMISRWLLVSGRTILVSAGEVNFQWWRRRNDVYFFWRLNDLWWPTDLTARKALNFWCYSIRFMINWMESGNMQGWLQHRWVPATTRAYTYHSSCNHRRDGNEAPALKQAILSIMNPYQMFSFSKVRHNQEHGELWFMQLLSNTSGELNPLTIHVDSLRPFFER